MRIFITPIFAISALTLLTACSGSKNPDMSTVIPVELVATHAFDTQTPIKSITFVPNNVAPWLGRLILLDTTGHLFSTDIEGQRAIALAPKKYIDIFGLSRDNAAGVVLAINGNNEIEAFLETDDEGGFSPMAYSGIPFKAAAFCRSGTPVSKDMKALTTDGKVIELKITINQNVVEQTLGNEIENSETCHTNAANEITLQPVETVNSPIFNPIPKSVDRTNTSPKQSHYAHTLYTSEGNLTSINEGSGEIIYNISVKNGLSIHGINKVDYLTATTANYGGAAFADGLIAMIDNNEQRIVFLSREYVERKVTEAMPSSH